MKRVFDFTVAGFLFLFASPLLLIIAVLLFAYSGSPIFFRQKRPGLNSKIFEIVKFRTMRNSTRVDESGATDLERLTKLGQILRAFSLDELPQLWNVLKGDMSLVGPRPLLPEYLPLYSAFQAKRHNVHPGLTGWAQINGRNSLSWDEKFELDVWYVENRSFTLDLQILLKTILQVSRRKDISYSGHPTMPPFRGDTKS